MFSLEIFKKICHPKIPNVSEYYNSLVNCMSAFGIDSELREIHFLAQLGHESMSFLRTKERSTGLAYEGKGGLGNIHPGDGAKFIGRGFIQLTGRFNYQRASDYFKIDFVKNPELIETPEWAAKISGWFWWINNLSRTADEDNFFKLSLKINGGFNGIKDRYDRTIQLKKLYGFSDDDITAFKAKLRLEITDTLKNKPSKTNVFAATRYYNFMSAFFKSDEDIDAFLKEPTEVTKPKKINQPPK